jgi:hypothetical protein
MLNLSLGNFFYLFMRLFPFIIVCFFVIISIFNWDLKGFVYLVGLIITTGLFQIGGNVLLNAINKPENGDENQITCVRMFDTDLPVNLIVIGFTIGYLFTTIARIYITNKQSFFDSNGDYNSIILFFITIAIFDLLINTNILPEIPGLINPNYCYRWLVWIVILSITIFCGWIWASIIYSTKDENYIFFNNFNKPFNKCAINNARYKCTKKTKV